MDNFGRILKDGLLGRAPYLRTQSWGHKINRNQWRAQARDRGALIMFNILGRATQTWNILSGDQTKIRKITDSYWCRPVRDYEQITILFDILTFKEEGYSDADKGFKREREKFKFGTYHSECPSVYSLMKFLFGQNMPQPGDQKLRSENLEKLLNTIKLYKISFLT